MYIMNANSYRHPLALPPLPAPCLNIEITQQCIRLFHSLWRRGCLFREAGSLTDDESLWSEPFDARRRSARLPHNVCDIRATTVLDSVSWDQWVKTIILKLAPVSTQHKIKKACRKPFPWLPPLLIFTRRNCLQTNKTLAVMKGMQNESMQNAIICFCLFGVNVLTGNGLTSMTIQLRTLLMMWPKKDTSLSVSCAVSDHKGGHFEITFADMRFVILLRRPCYNFLGGEGQFLFFLFFCSSLMRQAFLSCVRR